MKIKSKKYLIWDSNRYPVTQWTRVMRQTQFKIKSEIINQIINQIWRQIEQKEFSL